MEEPEEESYLHSPTDVTTGAMATLEDDTTVAVGQMEVNTRDLQGRGPLTLSGQMSVGGQMTVNNNKNTYVVNKQQYHNPVNYIQEATIIQNSSGYKLITEKSKTEIESTANSFTENESYTRGLGLLGDSGFLLITGPPRSGKTLLGHALLRHFQSDDVTPLVIKSYEEWREHVGGEQKQIVLLDDVFGKGHMDDKWKDSFVTIEKCARSKQCLTVMIISKCKVTGKYAELENRVDLSGTLSSASIIHVTIAPDMVRKALQASDSEEIPQLEDHICVERTVSKSLKYTPDRPHVQGTETSTKTLATIAGEAPLHAACREEDMDTLMTLLKQGKDPNQKSYHGVTALHVSCFTGRGDMVEILLQHGARADERDTDDWTPLHFACQQGHLAIVEKLLFHAAKGQAKKEVHHLTCDYPHRQVVHSLQSCQSCSHCSLQEDNFYLCREHADKIEHVIENVSGHRAYVNMITSSHATALHLAAQHGHGDVVRHLLKNGACTDMTVDIGSLYICDSFTSQVQLQPYKGTALHAACHEGHQDVVQTLLHYKAATCAALLHIASYNGHNDIVQTLLDHGVSADGKDKADNLPLHWACTRGHATVVETLLRTNEGKHVGVKNNQGLSPLKLASLQENVCTVRALLRYGASVNVGSYPYRPLDVACKRGDTAMVEALLDHGAAIEYLDDDKKDVVYTPLKDACRHGHDAVVAVLIDHGARVDVTDYAGGPFHWALDIFNYQPYSEACLHHAVTIVKKLLDAKADVNTVTWGKISPLHAMCKFGGPEIVQLFLQHGADVNAETIEGQTPLLFAFNPILTSHDKKKQTIETLLQYGANVHAFNSGPIHAAGRDQEDKPVLEMLLRHMSKTDSRTSRGETALHLACQYSCEALVLEILQDGADQVPANPHNLEDTNTTGTAVILDGIRTYGTQNDNHALEVGANFNTEDANMEKALHNTGRKYSEQVSTHLPALGPIVNAKDQDGTTALHCAVRKWNPPIRHREPSSEQNYQIITHLLEYGANVNAEDNNGETPLLGLLKRVQSISICYRNQYFPVLETLLRHMSKTDSKTARGETALHLACQYNCEALVLEFLHRGADQVPAHSENLDGTDDTDITGTRVMHDGVRTSSVQIDSHTLKLGAKLNTKDADGGKAFHNTGRKSSEQVSTHLLALGAILNAKDHDGTTALHCAVRSSSDESIIHLLGYGANVNAEDNNGATALQDLLGRRQWHSRASSHGRDRSMIETLLRNMAKTDSRTANGETALHLACRYNCEALVLEFLQHGADQTPAHSDNLDGDNVTDTTGKTVIRDGVWISSVQTVDHKLEVGANLNTKDTSEKTDVQKSSVETVDHVLEYGANVNAKDCNGAAPLHFAVRSSSEQIISHLLEFSANVNQEDNNGATPIQELLKCLQCSTDRTQQLPMNSASLSSFSLCLRHGADLKKQDKAGNSLLHFACLNRAPESVVNMLIESGSPVNLPNKNGDCPLHIVCKLQDIVAVRALLKAGASPEIPNNSGLTALDIVSDNNCTEIAVLLLLSLRHKAPPSMTWRDSVCNTHPAGDRDTAGKADTQGTTKVDEPHPASADAAPNMAQSQENSDNVDDEAKRGVTKSIEDGHDVNTRAVTSDNSSEFASEVGTPSADRVTKDGMNTEMPSISAEASPDNDTTLPLMHPANYEDETEAVTPPASNVTKDDQNTGNLLDVSLGNGATLPPLHAASYRGDTEAVTRLLLSGCAINSRTSRGHTALHYACVRCHKTTAQVLLEKQADVDAQDREGRSALSHCSGLGLNPMVNLLLRHGAKVDLADGQGREPLHWAWFESLCSSAVPWLGHGDLACCGSEGHQDPALSLSTAHARDVTASLLLAGGAVVNHADCDGNTPLHLAASKGDSSSVGFLLTHGADVNGVDKNGNTPLHLASSKGHASTAAHLLAHGADVERSDRDGHTPLHLAAAAGNIDLCLMLVQPVAKVTAPTQEPLRMSRLAKALMMVGDTKTKRGKSGHYLFSNTYFMTVVVAVVAVLIVLIGFMYG